MSFLPGYIDMGPFGSLLGCEWGGRIQTADDPFQCEHQAVQQVILHEGPCEMAFKLCIRHRDRVFRETTSRPGMSEVSQEEALDEEMEEKT